MKKEEKEVFYLFCSDGSVCIEPKENTQISINDIEENLKILFRGEEFSVRYMNSPHKDVFIVDNSNNYVIGVIPSHIAERLDLYSRIS